MFYPESLVWLIEEQVWGNIVDGMGAYYSIVEYEKNGIEYEVFVENSDFILLEDFS